MSEAKFTKGEWVISERHNEYYVEANHDSEGFCDLICEGVYEEENAHLISAAPEMYEMLERCKKEMSKSGYDASPIENLLAKARGES